MKNHKKMLILFMFLFIYFVMPRDVFAAQGFCYVSQDKSAYATIRVNYANGDSGSPKGMSAEIQMWNKEAGSFSNVIIDNLGSFDNYLDTNSQDNNVPPGSHLTIQKYKQNWLFGLTSDINATVWIYNSLEQATRKRNTLETEGHSILDGKSDFEQNVLIYDPNCLVTEGKKDNLDSTTPDASLQENTGIDVAHNRDVTETLEEIIRESKIPKPPIPEQKKQDCESVFGKADGSQGQTVAWILQKIFNYIRIFGIFLTIVLGAFDFTKSIISNDFDSLKKSQTRLIYRIIGIVALLLLPVLINFLLGLFISGSVNDFSCGIF